ncbi:PASTA domain-containing protein [Actinoplanes friuliensis]|nr:hypothetical protein [Actinoplanes friuliensis]
MTHPDPARPAGPAMIIPAVARVASRYGVTGAGQPMTAGATDRKNRWLRLPAGLVLLVVFPLIAAGWAVYTVALRILHRNTASAPSPARTAVAALIIIVLGTAGAGVYVLSARPSESVVAVQTQPVPAQPIPTPETTPAASVPPGAVMPDALGMPLPAAESLVRSIGLRYVSTDRSPLGRRLTIDTSWTVVASNPRAGRPVFAGGRVALYALKNNEAAWFAAHPVMPRLAAGATSASLVGPGDQLADVEELVSFTEGARPGTVPAAGRRLRPGQLIVVTTKPGNPTIVR